MKHTIPTIPTNCTALKIINVLGREYTYKFGAEKHCNADKIIASYKKIAAREALYGTCTIEFYADEDLATKVSVETFVASDKEIADAKANGTYGSAAPKPEDKPAKPKTEKPKTDKTTTKAEIDLLIAKAMLLNKADKMKLLSALVNALK